MRIAGVQTDIHLGQVSVNSARMSSQAREAVRQGADLVVFPECALTGYCFHNREEAFSVAQTIPGPATGAFQKLCQELNCHLVFGMLEAAGSRLFNVAVMVGPEGVVGVYRKVHLPWLGVDRFADYGDQPFSVHDCQSARIGLNICYDAGFPEPSRCLALLGSDLIVLPTNWPAGASAIAEYAINTRALENTIYYAAVNRIGVERGTEFIGQSRICDPLGRTLAHANHADEEILYATVDVALSRQKHLVRTPGTNEVNRIADRRPEMYGLIVQAHQLQRPGQRVWPD